MKPLSKHVFYQNSIYLIFIFGFYLQNRFAISCSDDWPYSFICEKDGAGYLSAADEGATPRPITSLKDAIMSQSADYFKSNGRFITHTLVQYFCGTMNMGHFVLLNTLVFALFTLCLLKLTILNRKILLQTLTVLSAIWLLIPFKGFTFMGNISLSINYLWAAAFNLLFLILYHHTLNQRPSSVPMIFISLMAFVIGSLQESFSICIAGSICLRAFIRRKNISSQHVIIIIAYIAGTLSCILSPANFQRAEEIGGFGFHVGSVYGLLASPVVWLFVLCVFFLIKKRMLSVEFRRQPIILTSVIINLLFILVIAYNGRHQLMALNILMFIFVFRVYLTNVSQKSLRTVALMLTVVSLVSYYPILNVRQNYHSAFLQLTERMKASTDGIVAAHDFETLSANYKKNLILNYNYITTISFLDWEPYERIYSLKLTKGKNPHLFITVLPDEKENIALACTAEHEVVPNLYLISRDAFSYFVYTSPKPVHKDSVTITALVKSKYFFFPAKEEEKHPNDIYQYKSMFYCLFNNNPEMTVTSLTTKSGQ